MGRLNVLIGANGSGKSNLIDFFRMMDWLISGQSLQLFIGKGGGGRDFLFDGPETTAQIEAHLTFETETDVYEYAMRLAHAAPDRLIFTDERYRRASADPQGSSDWETLKSGNPESELPIQLNPAAKFILNMMKRCKVYQFHNTARTAGIRAKWDKADSFHLQESGSNLAPFLLRLKEDEPAYYRRIVTMIRQIARFFDDFILEEEHGKVMLQWREKDSDKVFGPHLASDGLLRTMALVALLLQPPDRLPRVTVLDEPELGLHPYAIGIIADLIHSASLHTQIILATQSTNLVDHFDPEHLIVVDRPKRASLFRRLDQKDLGDWLEDYSLSELWEKNVLGGRPQ